MNAKRPSGQSVKLLINGFESRHSPFYAAMAELEDACA